MKPPRNIVRIDNPVNHTHGWTVRLQRHGSNTAKVFSDGVHGGKSKALRAAIEYRDAWLSQHPVVEHHLWVCTRLRKNNTSGIPGVGRYDVLANANTGRRNVFWMASWTDEHGFSCHRKFYVSRYGEREAKRRAVAERESQLHRVCAIKGA